MVEVAVVVTGNKAEEEVTLAATVVVMTVSLRLL